MNRSRSILIYLESVIVLLAVVAVGVGESPATRAVEGDGEQSSVVVLDTTGFWRMHHTLRPPLIHTADGFSPALMDRVWLDAPTDGPSGDWPSPAFDDSAWVRGPTLMAIRSPYLSRLCMRGKFKINDPGDVGQLRLSVDFRGGIVVYLNGKEIARRHLSTESKGTMALAEGYPLEAFVSAAGSLIERRTPRDAEMERRIALRTRTLSDFALPAGSLRKGVNILALELVRAPYHQAVRDKVDPKRKMPYGMSWDTCGIRRVQLIAVGGGGVEPNVNRPVGLQVWNRDLMASDFDMDFGDPHEVLRPIRIVGARNGVFCGKVVIGSDKAIRGLSVSVGELTSDKASIPATAVGVRWGFPWGDEFLTIPYSKELRLYAAEPSLLEGLAESPLPEYPVREKETSRYTLDTPGQPESVFGAVVPVWIKVSVPGSAKAGDYVGKVTIRSQGESPVTVPIELRVADWALPAPQDYRTWVELIQSPDSLAVEYGVDLWSDDHLDLMGRSLRFLNQVGSRVVYIPLISQSNQGNAESMVRWIDKGNGRYEHDFSVMEKYLDLAEKHMGKPKIVVFNVWDVYLIRKDKQAKGQEANAIRYLKEKDALLGEGPGVTTFDPASGEANNIYLPPYAAPGSKELWQPLFAELLQRMKRRGLSDVMMLGTITDAKPTKEEVEVLAALAPGVPWVCHSHHGWFNPETNLLHRSGRVAYQTRVWNIEFPDGDTAGLSKRGWMNRDLLADYERNRSMNSLAGTTWRQLGEYNVAGGQRGIGRIGADFWSVIKDSRGRRQGQVWARYPQSSRRNLDIYTAVLAPGPDGPVATTRYEIFREGIQECEARIFIEAALADKSLAERLSPALIARCEKVLIARISPMFRGQSNLQLDGHSWDFATSWRASDGIAGHTWFVGSGWQERSWKLYELAGEVAKKLE